MSQKRFAHISYEFMHTNVHMQRQFTYNDIWLSICRVAGMSGKSAKSQGESMSSQIL